MTSGDSLAFLIVFVSGALTWPAAELLLSRLTALRRRHRHARSIRI